MLLHTLIRLYPCQRFCPCPQCLLLPACFSLWPLADAGTSRVISLVSSQGCHFRCATMGGAAGGVASASLMLPVHSNGRCLMLPGILISSSASSAASSTARCVSLSPGRPMVWPKGCSIAASRGTLVAIVRSAMFDSAMVVIPARSISRCASPTDRQQTGQAGTRTAASTASALRCSTILGMLRDSSSCGSRR